MKDQYNRRKPMPRFNNGKLSLSGNTPASRPLGMTQPGSLESFIASLDALLDGFAILSSVRDETGKIIDFTYEYINQVGHELNQRAREEHIGRTLLELLPAHRETGILEEYIRVVETGKPLVHESLGYEDTFGEGQRLKRFFDARAIKMGDGFALTWRDVTAQVQAKARAETSEAIFDSLSEAIIVYDAAGIITKVNPSMVSMLQFNPLGMRRADIFKHVQIFSPDGRTVYPEDLPSARANQGVAVKGERFLVQTPDGVERFILASASPLYDAAANMVGAVSIWHDITEQVQARQQAEAERSRLSTILANAPIGIVVADAEGQVGFTNAIADELFRYLIPTGGVYTSDAPFRITSPDGTLYTPRDLPLTRSALDGESFINLDIGVQWPDGRSSSLLVNTAPILDKQGKISGAVGVFQDITQRKELEQALQSSEQRFRQLADSMPQLVWTARPDGTVDYYNVRYQEFEGIAHDPGTGWQWSPVLHEADQQATLDAWNQAVETGQVYQVEHRVRMRDGSYRWHLSRGIPARDENGQVVKWYGTATDIHDFKQAEQALRASEERFRIALANAPLTVFSQDRDLRYTWIYQPRAGFEVEEVLGKRDEDLLSPEDAAVLTNAKRPVLETGVGCRQEVEYQIRGETVIYNLTIEPLRAASGEITGITVAALDVTQMRRVEAEASQNRTRVEVQHRLIEQREQERLQIARDLHDGPIQSLYGVTFDLSSAIELVKDQAVEDLLQASMDTIREQIGDLRLFMGELRPPTLLKFGLEKAILSHSSNYREKYPELALHLDLNSGDGKLDESVQLALYRIYQEALNNINKHARADAIWVRYNKAAQEVVLEIQDNGAGFVLPRQWVDLARKGHLGLVGIQERAEAIGGSVTVRSRPGKGTTLSVRVPLGDSGGKL